ncbi:MAG TPA: alpha/beta fold hydrolase [Methylomirabilota bacterium]|nr:alpha/beta fold hydrolase [Methylomirabilota bacterium]
MATYVLIHGAYQGGWIWKPVAERLRAGGHRVYAPTLEGCAERRAQVRPGITVASHAEEIAALLFYEDLRDTILVGTSSGGMVLCKAAELGAERVARVVFVDALALLPGERVSDIVTRPAGEVTALTIAPTRADAESRMFADLPPTLREWALARYTPHPIAALEAPMGPTTFWERAWTASVIRCRRARNPPEAHQRRTAERLKAPYAELDTGHYPMLSEPEELTRLLA